MKPRDLGLTYEQALHGVQSAITFDLQKTVGPHFDRQTLDRIKHLRVGVDARAADAYGLATLLIAKGVFTAEEYSEHLRLAMNEELARYTEHCHTEYNLQSHVEFR